ncbi:MAG TPA: LPXTG cell wall anchor domain-containing protein [Candidatus Limnocylindrales bacterium]|nr:LPXTG cell wall anchor domain-containing protein [Candidatus Limnocylindrales bacterium]
MKRVLRRAAVGAAAFFAASAFAAPAAFADSSADLGVTLAGTTIDSGTSVKRLQLTVTNHGPDTADGFTLAFDTSGLNASKVELVLPAPTASVACDTTTKTCKVTGPIKNTENFDYSVFRLRRLAGTGDAGSLTVKVSSDTADPKGDNNSATAAVTLSGASGVDLKVLADDVWVGLDENDNPIPINPGENGVFGLNVMNQGSVGAQGAKVTIVLPPGVSFTEQEEGCVYSDGNRQVVCTWEGAQVPADGKVYSLEMAVKVASTVTPMVNIPGGTLTIDALGEMEEEDQVSAMRAAPQTSGFVASDVPPPSVFQDIDATDNRDDFIAYIGGTLPKTGTKVLLTAGIGAGVLIVGGALFLITRRRRVAA